MHEQVAMDAVELGKWYEEMGAGLVLYARQIAGAEGADVVQEAFMKLAGLKKRPGNVKGWLLVAVRRRALDVAKGNRRREVRDRVAGMRMFESNPREQGLEAAEVEGALKGLALEEREVVTMRIWNGASFEEIGGVMGMPVSTVYHRYRSGLEALRARLELPCRKK